MKTFRKYIGLFILLGVICSIISCDRPMPFDKDKWLECGGFDGRFFINDDHFVDGNIRYRMSLWLEKNYNFCGKSLNEIMDKFYITPEYFEYYVDSLAFEDVKNNKILNVIIKQYDPNFLGIDPWIDTDWIEIYFDENYMVSKVYYVHYNRIIERKTKREICAKN